MIGGVASVALVLCVFGSSASDHAALDSGVTGSYPKGYEDSNGYLRAGATSLDLAADSVRGFNETADIEYLRDYRRLRLTRSGASPITYT
jgi:hypothetical protein